MKTKIVLLLAVVMVAIATPAMAQKIQALNIFPYTQSEIDVPLYAEDPESMCLTDIVGTICEVNQDAGTWRDINYSGSVDYAGSVPFSGSAYYDGPLLIAAEGTVPFETAVFDHTGTFTYAVTAPPCVGGLKQGCCEAKGDPDGTVHLVCYKVILNENYFESFDYDVYRQDIVNVPWTFNGTGHYAGYVPYSGTADYSGSASYSGTIQNAYKEYAPADVIFAEGNVVLDCPPQDQVPTQTVSFKELVTNAYVGDTIELEASGYTALEKTVTYQVVVRYAEPGKRIFTRVFRTDKVVETVNGIFKEQLEGGYTFEKAGTYQFVFKVWKPSGVLAGKAVTRTVIVTE
jgi:hypothetical protein